MACTLHLCSHNHVDVKCTQQGWRNSTAKSKGTMCRYGSTQEGRNGNMCNYASDYSKNYVCLAIAPDGIWRLCTVVYLNCCYGLWCSLFLVWMVMCSNVQVCAVYIHKPHSGVLVLPCDIIQCSILFWHKLLPNVLCGPDSTASFQWGIVVCGGRAVRLWIWLPPDHSKPHLLHSREGINVQCWAPEYDGIWASVCAVKKFLEGSFTMWWAWRCGVGSFSVSVSVTRSLAVCIPHPIQWREWD